MNLDVRCAWCAKKILSMRGSAVKDHGCASVTDGANVYCSVECQREHAKAKRAERKG